MRNISFSQGSSPLSRGALLDPIQLPVKSGIIPALAGSTQSHPCQRHRACGSSPLSRGARVLPSKYSMLIWDHPRSRGEHSQACVDCRPCWGSSPLSRGAQSACPVDTGVDGIIPALAGSTAILPSMYHFLLGSSPLSRGAPRWESHALVLLGIIPALAGSTRRGLSRRGWRRDHPRSRGEHGTDTCRASRSRGSSPLSRGAHCSGVTEASERGIIPALAGSTRPRARRPQVAGDHPRSRGEHRGWSGLVV